MCGSKIHFDTAFHSYYLKDYELIAIDLPGFGDSYTTRVIDIEVMLKAVNEVIKYYSVTQPWIVAHSMASSIAIRLLNEIDGVVFLEGNLIPEHLSFSSKIIQIERIEYRKEYERIKALASMAMRYQTHIKDFSLIDHYASTYKMCNSNAVWDAALICVKEMNNRNLESSFSDCEKSINLIYGLNSEYIKTINEVKEQYTIVNFFPIENCGHFPMIDNPEETWKIVASKLN